MCHEQIRSLRATADFAGFLPTLDEREGIAGGRSAREIARTLGRSHTTIAHEIGRCGGRTRYRAHAAEREAWQRARRLRPTKLELCGELRRVVEDHLCETTRPEQIAGWLRLRYPDSEAMQVSHETIYRAGYVQARGSLKRELTPAPEARPVKALCPLALVKGPGQAHRDGDDLRAPARGRRRAVPGHWEGDLVMGNRQSPAAIATLVERSTRYCQLIALPEPSAKAVADALAKSITTLPAQLRRSLTWDQGSEMAEHRRFAVESGVDVDFCDPQSPWQRGSNENTNRLLRRYFPKGESLAGVTKERLEEVAAKLNSRPRKTLGFATPAQKLTELIDAVAERRCETSRVEH